MISIGVVARQTGMEISTLRKWEERYGFPMPVRLESGQRRYRDREVQTLLAVVRRVAAGERPGQVIRELNDACLATEALSVSEPLVSKQGDSIQLAMAALIRHDLPALRKTLEEALDARSMAAFIDEIAGPMTRLVGDYWARGDLPIYGEHLYSAALESLLVRETSLSKGAVAQPKVLLTTPGGEFHTLGLSMVNAVLGEAGVASWRLHGGLPVSEIAQASKVYGVRAVGVSVTKCCPPKILAGFMRALRNALPADVALWFGGAGVNQVPQIPPGITLFASMVELSKACESLDLSGTNAPANMKAGQ